MDALKPFAPIKKKYARGNQIPFMTKNLSKEIMTRTNCYGNLNQKDLTDNKKFWETVKPSLSDKSMNSAKLILMKMEN